MSYTPPSGGLVELTWEGAAPYAAPAGDSLAFEHAAVPPTIDLVAVVGVTASLLLEHLIDEIAVTLTVSIPVVAGIDASHGVAGSVAAVVTVSADQTTDHGVALVGIASITLQAAASIVVDRYELRGEIRLAGVLVNRRVRAYLRSSGALLGEADTVVGRFQVHTGFAAAECYVTPIDMSAEATDWLPPTANRLMSVLAEDAA